MTATTEKHPRWGTIVIPVMGTWGNWRVLTLVIAVTAIATGRADVAVTGVTLKGQGIPTDHITVARHTTKRLGEETCNVYTSVAGGTQHTTNPTTLRVIAWVVVFAVAPGLGLTWVGVPVIARQQGRDRWLIGVTVQDEQAPGDMFAP